MKIWTKDLLKTRSEVVKDMDEEMEARRPRFQKDLAIAIEATLTRRESEAAELKTGGWDNENN